MISCPCSTRFQMSGTKGIAPASCPSTLASFRRMICKAVPAPRIGRSHRILYLKPSPCRASQASSDGPRFRRLHAPQPAENQIAIDRGNRHFHTLTQHELQEVSQIMPVGFERMATEFSVVAAMSRNHSMAEGSVCIGGGTLGGSRRPKPDPGQTVGRTPHSLPRRVVSQTPAMKPS